jgi:hypothetical protein
MRRTRSLRARLNRLTPPRSEIEKNGGRSLEFTIDPALAKALRDDCQRLDALKNQNGEAPTPARIEEESMLRARIADRARAINCPAEYGIAEYANDERRLRWLTSPISCDGSTLNAIDDAEEAQLRARIAVFDETTDEGRARRRMAELSCKRLNLAELDELDRLEVLYPPPPPDPNDPLTPALIAIEESLAQDRRETRQRHRKRLLAWKAQAASGD